MFRWVVLVLVLAAVVAGLVVGVLNPDSVTIDLILVQASIPLGALMLISVSLGLLAGLVLALLLFIVPGRLTARRRNSSPGAGEKQLTRAAND